MNLKKLCNLTINLHKIFSKLLLSFQSLLVKERNQGSSDSFHSPDRKNDFEKDSELDEIATKSTMTESMVNFRGRLMLAHLFITKLKQLKGSLT